MMSTQTILVVEDDLQAREGYRELLKNAGFHVLAVGSGDLALRLADAERLSAVVLDLDLPVIDGWEVARRLRADPKTQDLPIICISGHTRQHEQASSLRAGCEVFLPKPLAPQELLSWIERLTRAGMTER